MSSGAAPPAPVGTRALYACALYDLANTTFSLNVVSRYLPLLVVEDLGGRDLHVSVAYSVAMVGVALSAPLLGALSDHSGRRIPFLAVATFACISATALMGFGKPMALVLPLFAIATYFYNAALVFYDALLANVSDESTRGRASALGIGLGYGGTIISLYSIAPIAERFGKAAAFPATALLFFVAALPCFLFVPDVGTGALWRRGLAAETFARVRATVRKLGALSGLTRFLCAHFLYADAVNTVILFMAVYMTKVGGFSSTEVTSVLALSTVFAIVGAFGSGPLIDRLGAKRALFGALGLWVAALALTAAAPSKGAFWLVGPLVGTALGSLWASDRVVMFRLSPPESLGEFYGIYGMVGRFAAITGPLVWGTVVYALEDTGALAYRAAVSALLAMLLAGAWVLRRIPTV